jgi:hypothetical protein
MTDRNRSDLDREQRGTSNPNQTERTEDRNTQSNEPGMGGTSRGNQNQNQGQGGNRGVGSESDDLGNVGSSREGGNRSTGNIEGDENLNRR